MKKLNFSLILKITGVVFIAFAIVLGNEIRLGIDRYIKNTLDTDAEATIRNLDKFSKSYVESAAVNSVDFQSSKFQRIYRRALSGDSTKVKCLVDKQGKILDISRDGANRPTICLIISGYQGTQSWPAYFNLQSMDETSLNILESELKDHQNEQNNVELKGVVSKKSDTDNEYIQVDIKSFVLNGKEIYSGKVKGKVEDISGYVSSYINKNIEIVFSTSVNETLKSSSITITATDSSQIQTQTLVLDYQNAMDGLEQEIANHFQKFKSSGKQITSSNYANAMLLNPYEYNGRYYSTVMIRLEDWSLIGDNEISIDYNDEESLNMVTAGYLFVTQEYEDLSMKTLKQFMYDNSSTYFLAFILIILICLSIAYMIVKPIRRIETTAKHIAHKEFDYPIDMTRHDELGDLARSIDQMSKELEKTINSLHQEIERVQKLEEARKEFVSNFTHEIKIPLGIINGFSELVELEQDEKKRNEYIGIIQNETKRINELVLAMLDLSKLESQNIALDFEEIDLLDIVDESLDSMMHLFEKKSIHVHTSLDSSVITADRFKMEMVVYNFISNALRYTEPGQNVYIHLDEHCFEVENDGDPIPNEDMEKIWLTFHKVDKARNAEGTGLGLAICKAILDLHHFEYGVKNTEKGVLFYFKY